MASCATERHNRSPRDSCESTKSFRPQQHLTQPVCGDVVGCIICVDKWRDSGPDAPRYPNEHEYDPQQPWRSLKQTISARGEMETRPSNNGEKQKKEFESAILSNRDARTHLKTARL